MQQVNEQMSLFDQDMPYGRMSPEPSAQTKVKTSESCSKSSAKSKTPTPLYLDLRRGGVSGLLAEPSWVTGIPSLGECLTLVFGESPSVAEESGLWQILQVNASQKYFLSATACRGVLRRAERRGKELPEILETALKQQIERWEKYGTPLPVFDVSVVGVEGIDIYNATTTGKVSKTLNSAATDSDHIPCVCYDARGNGDGKTVPTITGDHNNRITDYTALCAEAYIIDPLSSNSMKSNNPHSGFHKTDIAKCLDTSDGSPNKNQGGIVIVQGYVENSSGNDLAGTLDASYYKGVGTRNGKEREFVVIAVDRSAFNQGENAKYNIGIDDNGTAFTVTAKGPGAVCYCLQGNTVDMADTASCHGKGVKENECYTLNTVDRHAVCYGFSPDNSSSCDGVNLNENLSPTLQVHKKLGVCEEIAETQYIVRRLTPLECCRLQGMPDFWLDGVEGSDAAQYKLWGNGMALPNALYIMEGIAQAESK